VGKNGRSKRNAGNTAPSSRAGVREDGSTNQSCKEHSGVKGIESMYERTPEELKAVSQWHCWKLVGDTKIPCQIDGKAAKSNDQSTWTTFDAAEDASQFHGGLAFELSDPWTGIDLDNCINDQGIMPWCLEILCRFDGIAFAEVSPSGNGIKLITRARKPAGARCLHKGDGWQIECYDNRRFWTITGDVYNGQDEIGDGQDAVNWLCEKFLSTEKKTAQPAVQIPVIPSGKSTLETRVLSYLQSVPQAGEGERNQCAFKLAGHLRSFEHDGETLGEDRILDFVRDWNSRNAKPLPDNELKSAISSSGRNGTAREVKPNRPMIPVHYPDVDLSKLLGEERGEDFDDEKFCADSVPESGLLREVFDYYCQTSHRTSCVMGLAVAVSLCETIFGRRIASHTDMRTNDYNVVMAPTASGKEACETVISKILQASGFTPILPPDVQSGNGLLKAVHEIPCGIWICDEFGKTLEAIIDRKSNNGHAKQIGTHLLKLYSKSSGVYGGAAHADGIRNQVEQPHLVLLGLTTGQMFETIDSRQIQDGLFGRIAFWPVQNRPKRKTARALPVPEKIANVVRSWIQWEPISGLLQKPAPEVVEMSGESLLRWDHHADAIDERMEHESESRAAIWGRVAARAMKLAMIHRAARIEDDPGRIDWQFVLIEKQDMDWGIRLANWLARVACGLIRENVVDSQAARARHVLESVVLKLGSVSRRDLMREYRSISGSEFTAAAESLQAEGRIEIANEETSGRPRVIYKRTETQIA